MRVALVSPKWNKRANDYPPLGLAYLAAVLEDDGHEVQVFDLGLEPDTPLEDSAARVRAFDPQVVGITAMTSVYHSALEAATLLKAYLGRPIIFGGPHPTVYPHRVLSEAPVIDYVVRAEGEKKRCASWCGHWTTAPATWVEFRVLPTGCGGRLSPILTGR